MPPLSTTEPLARVLPDSSISPTLRAPTPDDGTTMWRLARHAVDENSPYAYLMMAEYFADTSIVAERDGGVVAFVTGFAPPADPTTLFIWQIVVGPSARRTGLAIRMLEELVDRATDRRFSHLEATVTHDNEASERLFRSFAHRRNAECQETPCFGADLFPAEAGPHQPETRFRVGPF